MLEISHGSWSIDRTLHWVECMQIQLACGLFLPRMLASISFFSWFSGACFDRELRFNHSNTFLSRVAIALWSFTVYTCTCKFADFWVTLRFYMYVFNMYVCIIQHRSDSPVSGVLEGKLYGFSLALKILLILVRFQTTKHYSHFFMFLIKLNFIRLVSVLHVGGSTWSLQTTNRFRLFVWPGYVAFFARVAI